MANDSFKIKKSLNIEPIAGASPTAEGDLAYNSSTNKLSIHNGTSASPVVTEAHTATLTNKTLTAPVISTISNTGTLTLPTSTDTLVGRATTDTLTNKTLTAPVISTISNTGTLTLPTSTDTLVGRATTDTLTNKTISGASNTITNVSLTSGVTGTLPIANGGTNRTGWTAQAVPFVSATDVLNEDVNNLRYITASTRFYVGAIGIATGQLNTNATSASNLAFYAAHTSGNVAVINSQSTHINTLFTHSDNTAGNGVQINVQRARGTTGSRAQAQSGDLIGEIKSQAYINSSTVTTHGIAGIQFYLDEAATAGSCGGSLRMCTTPTGTITPKERLRLQQDGSLEFVGATSGYVAVIPPATVTSHTLTLPSAQGAASTVLANNGSGTLSWTTIANANISASAAIDATKIADGSISNTEFQYLNGASSNIQNQINAITSAASSSYEISNCSLAVSVAANAMTVALKDSAGNDPSGGSPVKIGFRNATAATGTYTQVSTTSAVSVVVSSGSTLGTTSAQPFYVYVYAIYDGSNVVLGVQGLGPTVDEGSVISTTAEGGAGAADSAGTIYTTSAQTNKPARLIGRILMTQATAGTWASGATEISLAPFRKRTLPTIQKFTSGSGTYTTPAGVAYIRVRAVGGGGGGSGSSTSAANNGNVGGDGGATYFGTSLISANGGTGGGATTGANGGTGGTASLGTGPIGTALSGANGSAVVEGQGVLTTYTFKGIDGAASAFGGAGRGGLAGANAGGAGVTNTGGGGGGAGAPAGGITGSGGGAGGFVDAIITSPNSSYAYTVGAAGAAGATGTGGAAGGAGGSGYIEVTEYYT